MNKKVCILLIKQILMIVGIIFIGNRVFNHFNAWVGIAVCLSACYPVINTIKLFIKKHESKN